MSPDARSGLEKRLDKYRDAIRDGWKGEPDHFVDANKMVDPDAATHEQVIGGRG